MEPGGNTTAIVRGVFSRAKRKKIALKILSSNRKVEQVGFWAPARSAKALARLEMAGGEFCGNATRSLAALIGKRGPFLLESRGAPEPIRVRSSKKSASFEFPTKYFREKNNVCELPGIVHLLKEGLLTRKYARKLLISNQLLNREASGVIGYKKVGSAMYEISPIVWVRDLKTLIAETACASGTMALANSFWKSNGITALQIKQPSGAIFKTRIKNRTLSITGPMKNLGEREIIL